MLELSQRLEQGEWIAIAADRVPIRGDKTQSINFLGHYAESLGRSGARKRPFPPLMMKRHGRLATRLNNLPETERSTEDPISVCSRSSLRAPLHRGIVLYNREFREDDKLVKIFTEKSGKRMFL